MAITGWVFMIAVGFNAAARSVNFTKHTTLSDAG